MGEFKKRLDLILTEREFFESREKAKRSIMAGVVFVNGVREDKPGTRYDIDVTIEIKKNLNPYVGRGGLKLEKAIREFNINLSGINAIDVGASTGGFTDCMLQNGARYVTAIDVGYGQIAWKLRNDDRVKVMDRTNIRYVKSGDIEYAADFASIDVSFISLKLVIPVVIDLLNEDGEIVCLVKPQFEAGRKQVGKKGVVRDKETHIQVLNDITGFSKDCGLKLRGMACSPIKGAEGNIEYLVYLSKKDGLSHEDVDIKELVEKTHSYMQRLRNCSETNENRERNNAF